MSSARARRFAATVAVGTLLFAFPAATAATITGGCLGEGHATSGGVDLATATEWHIRSTDVVDGSGTAPAPIRSASVGAYAAGISIPIVSPSGGVWVIGNRTTKRGLVWLSLAATRPAGRSFP